MENSNKPQYNLLEFLQQAGIAQERNVSEFIAKEFADAKPTKIISNEQDKGVQFLQALAKRDYIKYNVGQLNNINNRYIGDPPRPNDLPKWFDEEEVMANITFAGLEYLNQHRLNESVIASNAILASNSTRQTFALFLAAVFTLITLGTTIGNYCISKKSLQLSSQTGTLLQTIQIQSNQIHALQIALFEVKKNISQKTMAKKTTPKN